MKSKKLFLISLFLILFLPIIKTLAQNQIDDSNLYFSFKKNGNNLLINIEGYLIFNKKKISTKDLSYEWKINLGENYEKIKTYQPIIVVENVEKNLSGLVKISPLDLSFEFEKYFSFLNKNKPKVVIVKYDKKNNLALPIKKLSPGDFLYPLTYYFSSQNLAYVWTVNDSQYYNSFLLDISNLTGENKITLRVYNLDNRNEWASDEVIIKK